jgi:hypothetical protein
MTWTAWTDAEQPLDDYCGAFVRIVYQNPEKTFTDVLSGVKIS